MAEPHARRYIDTMLKPRAQRTQSVPDPRLVLLSSSLLALLICGLYRYGSRLGLRPIQEWMFTKEGPLEDATFLAELVAALFMALAARRVWLRAGNVPRKLVAIAYAGLFGLLFVVAMEEISWGQQFFHFATPESWSRVNYQHETTLHNLLDREGVNELGHLIRLAFVMTAVTMTVLSFVSRNELIQGIAPHPSLLVLTIAIAISGYLHGEVFEALVAFYFAFYSYRAFRMSASPRRPD